MPHLPIEERAQHEQAAMRSFSTNPTGYVAEQGLNAFLPAGTTAAVATSVAAPRFARKSQQVVAESLTHNPQLMAEWSLLAKGLTTDAIKGELEGRVARNELSQKTMQYIDDKLLKHLPPESKLGLSALAKARSINALGSQGSASAQAALDNIIFGAKKARYHEAIGAVFGWLSKHKMPLIAGSALTAGALAAGRAGNRLDRSRSMTPENYQQQIASKDLNQAIDYQRPRPMQLADVAWQALAE